MLASGWQIGKLMNLFDISDLAVWEHEMFEAQFWRDVFFFFFFFSAPFWTAEVSGSWTVLLGSLQAWTNTGGHFYPGGPGSAREMAKSKPELLTCWLGGGWGLEGGPGLRPGVGSRLGHCLRHW